MNDEYIEIKQSIPTEPSQEDIKEYAKWGGLDPETDQDLFYIAREALLAGLPPYWKLYQKKGENSDPFYFNIKTGESSWDHPLDHYYKELFKKEKEKKLERQKLGNTKIERPKNQKKKMPNQLKLSTRCFLTVPFQNYEEDFTFIVNNTEYKTNKIVADILSPLISKIHLNDPTFDTFKIDTKQKGDFNAILNLLNFEYNSIPIEEVLFATEVIEILQTEIKSTFYGRQIITNKNVVDLIKTHEKLADFYQKQLKDEIEFAASHFNEIVEEQKDKLKSLSLDMLELIISNENLVLTSEDQLLQFINDLYISNNDFSILYEYVHFLNVSKKSITDFLNHIQFESMNKNIWFNVSLMFRNFDSIYSNDNNRKIFNQKRYLTKTNVVDDDHLFRGYDVKNGIIYSLLKKSEKVEVNSSSTLDDKHSPQNLINYDENKKKHFSSENVENSWVSFNFNDYSVIPLNYTLQSDFSKYRMISNPKDWVIEGSNDNVEWSIIDEQKNVSFTNTTSYVHTFSIKNSKLTPFKYLRLRMTGKNWGDDDYLKLGSIEFYGNLVK